MRTYMILLAALVGLLAFGYRTPHVVKGKVVDEGGQPLAAVTISEKGKTTATTSGADGSYTITLSSAKARLVFSAVGYATKEVAVKGKGIINIALSRSGTELQEVVVTGYTAPHDAYSYQDRAAATTRVAKEQALSGRVAGVQVQTFHNSAPGLQYEGYDAISENSFHKAKDEPLSTFSIDVDAASYSNVRRFLNGGSLPPAGAVRIEEMINYFSYDYPAPTGKEPFSVHTELGACPWNKDHQLVMVGLQGKKIPVENLPSSNLVFLIDVSGSMQDELKLPLVKASLKLLTDQLRSQDRISIVVYAGSAGLVLPPVSGAEKIKIKGAIDALEAGGSTAGGEGIRLAYKVAREQFIKGGNNRVILCTDGDFNVGVSSNAEMEKLIESERASGVFLTVLGYGMGNYQDSKMQILADKGNGNHAYIDGLAEAKKVLVNEFGGTLFTIAKDVKLQVEFNPAKVQGYRLLGYENRMLQKEDFNDDKKDAGEMGSGHTVTALYELIPVGVKSEFLRSVDSLKYQASPVVTSSAMGSKELLTVKFRYKAPDGNSSLLFEKAVHDVVTPFEQASVNYRFATAVAEFGMLLRGSSFRKASSYQHVYRTARAALGNDREGYRKEFVNLVRKASALTAVAVDNEEEDVVIDN